MKRFLPIVVLIVAAFVAGRLAGADRAVQAAPASQWEPAVETWYRETGPLFLSFRHAVEDYFRQVTVDRGEATRAYGLAQNAGESLARIEPPVPMLAVNERILYALDYCTRIAEWMEGIQTEELVSAFGMPIFLHTSDHCLFLIQEARVERARYAAEHGPFPELPAPTVTPTRRAAATPAAPAPHTPVAFAPRATPEEGRHVDDLGIPYTLEVAVGVTLLSLRARTDRVTQSMEWVGEIQNIALADGLRQITVTAYDADGRVVDTASANPETYPLGVGERSAFSLWTDIPVADVVSYRLQVQP